MMYQQVMEDFRLSVNSGVLSLLSRIGRVLVVEKIPSYLVGGFVRDILLGRDTADIDIALAAKALEVAPSVARSLGGRYVLLDEINEIGRVVVSNSANEPTQEKWYVDFATLRGDIEEDLARRDFTIDAMAIKMEDILIQPALQALSPGDESSKVTLNREMLIDPFNGYGDLQKGLIRSVSESVFQSDAARLLRAVRLAACLGFSIDSETEALMRRDCQLIAGVAGERVREELLRLLAVPRAGHFLSYLDQLGILTTLIPEMARTKGVAQPFVHFWDVFDHSLQAVSALEFLLREGDLDYAGKEVLAAVPWSPVLKQHFNEEVGNGSTRKSLLKLALLLHDVAKPQTKALDENGRARFLGHPAEGAETAAGILERLRFSSREARLVKLMVEHHLRPGQMSPGKLPSRRAIYRYFRDTGEAAIDILFLSLADHLATRGPTLDMTQWQWHAKMVQYVLDRRFEEEGLVIPVKLIDGHDLINTFDMSPGHKIGELLEAVREAQATGEVTSRQEALDYVKRLLDYPPQLTPDNESP